MEWFQGDIWNVNESRRIFFLHPHDERALNSEVLSGNKRNIYTREKLASKFQNGVKYNWSKNDTRDKKYLFHGALGW